MHYVKDENKNSKVLAMAAILSNLDRFPNVNFKSEFTPILIKEIAKGMNGPESWFLNNFTKVIEFFIKKKLLTEDYLEILKCFFEVLIRYYRLFCYSPSPQ